MKTTAKLITIILLITTVISFSGCSSSSKLIDKAENIEKIVVYKYSTKESIELEDSEDIASLVSYIDNTSVSSPSAQEKWNSMGSNVTYTYHYSLKVTTKDRFLKKSEEYVIIIGREYGSGTSKKTYPTYVSREGKKGEVSQSCVDHIKELFLEQQE